MKKCVLLLQLSFSETDPALMMAATIFVDELIRRAAEEVDRRVGKVRVDLSQ